jgi:hypothetical protein
MPSFSDRTIDRFKKQLTGGGARSNLFEVSFGDSFDSGKFDFPGDIGSVEASHNMLIKTAGLPASTISEIPVPFRGRTLKIAGDRTFDVWSITVINDTDFKWRNIFERWMNYIVKVSDGSGTIDPSEYQTDVTVSQLSRGKYTGLNTKGTAGGEIDVLRTYKIHGVFPTNVSQIDVSYNNENEIEEFTVDLQVQWWEAADASNTASSQVV